jgi:hypothetical protein
MPRCAIKSLKLNCGCCDEVLPQCDLHEGHIGMHHFYINETNHTYEIVWTDVSAVSRETVAEPVSRETHPGVSPDFTWG